MRNLLLIPIVLLACVPLTRAHPETEEAPPPPREWLGTQWAIGFDIQYFSLDPEVTQPLGVGDDAWSVSLSGRAELGPVGFLRLAFGGLLLDDRDQFVEYVEVERYGRRDRFERESSEVTGYSLSAELGHDFILTPSLRFTPLVGYSHWSIDRQIPDCYDCRTEDIDLDGGPWVAPEITLRRWNTNFRFSYQHFLSGNVEDGFRLMFEREF